MWTRPQMSKLKLLYVISIQWIDICILVKKMGDLKLNFMEKMVLSSNSFLTLYTQERQTDHHKMSPSNCVFYLLVKCLFHHICNIIYFNLSVQKFPLYRNRQTTQLLTYYVSYTCFTLLVSYSLVHIFVVLLSCFLHHIKYCLCKFHLILDMVFVDFSYLSELKSIDLLSVCWQTIFWDSLLQFFFVRVY